MTLLWMILICLPVRAHGSVAPWQVGYSSAARHADVLSGASSLVQSGGARTETAPSARDLVSDDRWADLFATPGPNGPVYAVAVLGDDVYIGGAFTEVNGIPAHSIARYDTGTDLWAALPDPDGGAGGVDLGGESASVHALLVLGSELYVGGDFSIGGGVRASAIARFDPQTGRWSALGDGTIRPNERQTPVEAMVAVGSDLYVGGSFSQIGGTPAWCVARYTPQTNRWSALGSDYLYADYQPHVLALAVSGATLYVGGRFDRVGPFEAVNLARWDLGTSRWSDVEGGLSSSAGFRVEVSALAVVGSDLYVGGSFDQTRRGLPADHIARWSLDSSSWAALPGRGGSNGVGGRVTALQPVGTDLYVGGQFTSAGGSRADGLGRLDTRTQTWLADPRARLGGIDQNYVRVEHLAVMGTDLYVGGSFLAVGGLSAGGIARYATSTGGWSVPGGKPFVGGLVGTDASADVLVADEGALYVGGRFVLAGGIQTSGIARFDPLNRTWSALGGSNGVTSLSGQIHVRAILRMGEDVYLGGSFTHAGAVTDSTGRLTGGVAANNLVRFNLRTGVWTDLGGVGGGAAGAEVHALAAIGTDLYVGGYFDQAGTVAAGGIARLDTQTGIWSSLGAGPRTSGNWAGAVWALVASGADLYVGGSFVTADGVSARNIARYTSTTQRWGAIGAADEAVQSLYVTGQTIYAGGSFSKIDNADARRVARFDGSTGQWTALSGTLPTTGAVLALAPGEGELYVGSSDVYRWDMAFGTWTSLGSGVEETKQFSLRVNSLVRMGPDLYVAGNFNRAGGKPSARIARWTAAPVAVAEDLTPARPGGFRLRQNAPNPFNPETVIEYQLNQGARVSLRVYDMLGREVARLIDEEAQPVGTYRVPFRANALPSGVYTYRLLVDNRSAVRRMSLLR